MKLRTFRNLTEFNSALAQIITAQATHNSETPFAIMLAGGGTPLAAYRATAEQRVLASEQLVLLFSDDRHVASDSPDSNYGNVLPMVSAMEIDDARILHVRGELALDDAKDRYAEDLQAFLDEGGKCKLGFVGLGADGHTCSLFNLEDAAVDDTLTLKIESTGGFDRVSVTRAFLQSVEHIIVLATGDAKIDMLRALLHDPGSIPAGVALAAHPSIEVWTDVAEASLN